MSEQKKKFNVTLSRKKKEEDEASREYILSKWDEEPRNAVLQVVRDKVFRSVKKFSDAFERNVRKAGGDFNATENDGIRNRLLEFRTELLTWLNGCVNGELQNIMYSVVYGHLHFTYLPACRYSYEHDMIYDMI